MKVKLKGKHPSLEIDKSYEVIGIEADQLRIIDKHNDPCLYPPGLFDVIDSSRPEEWVTTFGEEGEEYSYPPLFDSVGFFEDYHNGNREVQRAFWEYVNERMKDDHIL